MQQRAHLKRKRKQIPKWKIFFFLMICALLCSFFCIFLAGKKLETIIINYATIETNRIASSILNSIVRDDLILPEEKLYEITMDNDQNIQLIDFNTKVSNELLSKLNREAMKRLIALENGVNYFAYPMTTSIKLNSKSRNIIIGKYFTFLSTSRL